MTRPRFGFAILGDAYREAFEIAADLPVDFIELEMNDLPPDRLLTEAEKIEELAKERDLDLFVHLPFGDPDLMLASSDPAVRARSRDRFEEAFAVAEQIGATKAVAHVDAMDQRHVLEVDSFETLAQTVDDVARTAETYGLALTVENMRGTSRRRLGPHDVAKLARETKASMTLDTGHARTVAYSDEDITALIEQEAAVISHVHLNDTSGPHDHHLPFQAGTTDFAQMFSALPCDWSGTLCIEIKVHDYDYVALSVEKLTRCWDELDRS